MDHQGTGQPRSVLLAAVAAFLVLDGLAARVVLGPDAAVNRVAIQKAVDETSAAGGGRVDIPAGEWMTGSIQLKDGVELHLARGATLRGSVNPADYNANDAFPDNIWSDAEEWSGGHLVWAWCAERIAITGEGTIDGNGPAFFGDCDEDSRFPWYKYGLKLHPLDREWFRPGMMVAFFRCRDIRLVGVTLTRTPAWTCHLRCCDGVDIRNVTIDADRTIANSDGFSIDCTRNVMVEKCVLKTGDDGFAIRASCRHHAETNFCENIEIRDCDIWSCCFGIRLGIGSGTIRNVRVVDTRIHEAADAGVGFTPAWIAGRRNCHIEDIRLVNCRISQCARPVDGAPSGDDSKIVGVLFEGCVFDTLLPVAMNGSDRCRLTFRNCVRNPLETLKVRHHWKWNESAIRNKRRIFAEVGGDRSKIVIDNCRPLPFGSTGVLLLSFDDRNFADWERAIPLFAKYGAHATFFVSGEFTPDAIRTAKKLMAEGHSIGLHGQHHANVKEVVAKEGWKAYCAHELDTVKRQCDVAYIPVRNFAYPDGCRDETTDKLLLTRFDRLRGPLAQSVRPYDPKGEKRAELKPLVTDERVFFPVAELPKRRVLDRVLIGEAYNTDIDDVVACIKRAAERKEVLALASHGIKHDAKGVDLKTEWLECILAAARDAGVAVLGYEETPLETSAGHSP